MANFTERAIKESFVKLLNDRPINKITVKDIVEDCGINRNSFYYHYQDVPDLIKSIIEDDVDAMIAAYPSIETIDSAINVAVDFAIKNKAAAMHLFNSGDRAVIERGLLRICDDVITKYINNAFPQSELSEEDRRLAIGMLKCEFFGIIINWMDGGMKTDLKADHQRFRQLLPLLLEKFRAINNI